MEITVTISILSFQFQPKSIEIYEYNLMEVIVNSLIMTKLSLNFLKCSVAL